MNSKVTLPIQTLKTALSSSYDDGVINGRRLAVNERGLGFYDGKVALAFTAGVVFGLSVVLLIF